MVEMPSGTTKVMANVSGLKLVIIDSLVSVGTRFGGTSRLSWPLGNKVRVRLDSPALRLIIIGINKHIGLPDHKQAADN